MSKRTGAHGGRATNETTAWLRANDGRVICAGCFGPIAGRHTVIGDLPYHPAKTSGFDGKLVRVCNPPQSLPGKRKVHPDQLAFSIDTTGDAA
jgi:hypothetical protein